MSAFFYEMPKNIARCFSGYNFFFHILAIVLTYVIVTSDLDLIYFNATRASFLRAIIFPAVALGGLLPIIVPLMLYIAGKKHGDTRTENTAFALAQSAAIALLISSAYKAFTGRIPPTHAIGTALVDASHGFQFGFMRGGVFWGWPSSHTTVAFAVAATLILLYPRQKMIKFWALFYAFAVGIGVSMSIHWFSEFIAGAIIGSVIGIVVGKSFRDRYVTQEK